MSGSATSVLCNAQESDARPRGMGRGYMRYGLSPPLSGLYTPSPCAAQACTIRTARSRTSGEDLFDLFMAPSSQRLEPPRTLGSSNNL